MGFCFGAACGEATDTGCFPVDGPPPGGGEFTTIAGGTTTTIEVTDAGFAGDIFRIELSNGSGIFFSSAPGAAAPFEWDPDAAFLSGRFSRAMITLALGFNSFRIFAEALPFGSGVGDVRVVSEPTIEVSASAAFALFGLGLAGLLTALRR